MWAKTLRASMGRNGELKVLGWLVNRGKELALTTNPVERLDIRAKNFC
jgi:hypothetical protein